MLSLKSQMFDFQRDIVDMKVRCLSFTMRIETMEDGSLVVRVEKRGRRG